MSNNTEAPKERAMIFNAEMVRALLNGSKTQTRRMMRAQPESPELGLRRIIESRSHGEEGKYYWSSSDACGKKMRSQLFSCPFGAVGDRIWVRETWMPDAPRDGTWGDVEFYGCKGAPLSMIPKHYQRPEHCIYHASWTGSDMVGWTPSNHMPRWASRITLEITGVRVERLQAITLGDICKEFGCGLYDFRPATYGFQAWADLWESIYGNGSWQANPWVWVIEYKRVEVTDEQ